MFQDAESYSRYHSLQEENARKLLDYVFPKMSFGEEEVVMDVGCGSGDNTRNILLPRLPKLKKLVAIDSVPEMIEFARTQTKNERIEFHLADVQDMSSLKLWEGSISKIFSNDCFHWLKNQKKGFQSLYALLRPKGEAAFVFFLRAPVWDCFPILINDAKWNKYLKDVDPCIPESHHLHFGEQHYRKILEDLGFEVLLCLEENRSYAFKDDAHAKDTLKPSTSLMPYIPDELMEEFMDEYFRLFLKFNGRNPEGLPTFLCTVLTIHVRKP